MSKIVVLTGSPRKNGNSNRMAEAFCEEARKLGHEVARIDTTAVKIGGCRACDACYKNGQPCVFEKEYTPIAEAVEAADGIVLAFPLYWYAIPAQIKSVIDHWYSFCMAGKDFAGKKAALITCCDEAEIEVLDGVKFAFEMTMKLMHADIVGEVLVPGVGGVGDIDQTDGIRRARELAARF